ncbi:IS91 family transposase [Piscirickettsia salmonis]|uniref:IS91 family transposase n=1 Tax=Piscirickettsia salmonis TaxID=1238 RepID=UPI0018ACED8E|nr:IS91 family transposase [Piscirickettsia salmonis]
MWKKATEQWIAAQNKLLPKCEYQHITFTMPKALCPFFLANRELLNHLSRLAANVLLKTAKKKKIKIGIFTALHTFGQSLNWNTHVHLSVTRGGLSKCKTTWKKVYFTKKKTMPMWRFSIVNLLRTAYKTGKLVIPHQYQNHITDLTSFNRFINPEYNKLWHVHFAKAQPSHHQNVDYLGRYLKRPPLSNSRLLHYDGKEVIFRYIDRKTGKQEKHTSTTFEFIERHIPTKSFKMIRYYGFLSFRTRGKLLPTIYKLLDQTVEPVKKITYASLLKGFINTDPFECILCGSKMLLTGGRPKQRLSVIMKHHKALATMQLIKF